MCPSVANATATCTNNQCAFTCNTGFHRCGNLCVADTSVTQCGASCSACTAPVNSTPSCTSGACAFTCNTGFHRCGNLCVADASVTQCGASCSTCTAPANATPSCANGACAFACNTGFHLCGNLCVADASVTQCGASCSACTAPANATPSCTSGACAFACNTGFHLCGGQCVANTSLDSCGPTSCSPCPAPPANGVASCNGLVCGVACAQGFFACDGQCVPGDYVSACGASCTACTVAAPAERATCQAGTCGTACITSCNLACVDVQRDASNCGACGVSCGSGSACVAGACRPSCTTGLAYEGTLPLLQLSIGSSFRPRFVDLNGDGRVELVDNAPSTGVAVRSTSMRGIGTATTVNMNGRPAAFVAEDLDGDGDLDLVGLKAQTTVQLTVSMNNGSNSFGAPATYQVGSTVPVPLLFVADVNGDGRKDIVLPAAGGVFRQLAGGGFAGTPDGFTGPLANAQFLATGDFNGDGLQDFALGSPTQLRVSLQTTTYGTWNHLAAMTVDQLGSLRAADVNGDANLDLVFRAGTTAVVHFGLGNGTFGAMVSVPSGALTDLEPIDVNGDSLVDLVSTWQTGVLVHLATSAGVFAPAARWRPALRDTLNLSGIAIANLTGSPAPEVLTWTINTGTFTGTTADTVVMVNDGAGRFPNLRVTPLPATFGSLSRFLSGDFDVDGDLDVVVFNEASGNTVETVFMPGVGDGTFGSPTQTLSLRGLAVASGQLNAHAGPDLVVAPVGLTSTTIDLFMSVAGGPFGARQTLTASGALRAISVADLDGDGLQDVVAATARTIQYFPGNGDGTFRPRTTVLSFTTANIETFAVGDLNLDGRPDLVVKRDTLTADLQVNTAFAPAVFDPVPRAVVDYEDEAQTLFLADMNDDGRLDLGITPRVGTGLKRYAGLGNGALSDQGLSDATAESYGAVAVDDLDGAFDLELVAMGLENPLVLFYGSQTVHFGAGGPTHDPGLAVGDFTGDGRSDVLVQGTDRTLRLLVGTCR